MHVKCLFIQILIVIISELNIIFRYNNCVTGSSPSLDEGSLHMEHQHWLMNGVLSVMGRLL